MSKRIEVECGDEEGDTEEERVWGRSSECAESEEGRSRSKAEGRGGGKVEATEQQPRPKRARKAAKNHETADEFGEERGEGTELADEKPG